MRNKLALLVLVIGPVAACKSGGSPTPTPPARPPSTPAPEPAGPPLTRLQVNQAATRLDLPLFWRADANKNGLPEADEVEGLLFYPSSDAWATRQGRAASLPEALRAIRRSLAEPVAPGLPAAEAERRRLVVDDLDQGSPTLVLTPLAGSSPAELQLVDHVLAASRMVDDLYATMAGAKALAAKVPDGDTASASLMRRNWSNKCVAPRTAQNAACNAVPGGPPLVSDVYPAELQRDPSFCAALEKRPDAKTLMAPFVVVRQKGNELVAVPYHEAYPAQTTAIARELRAAATALAGEPAEAPLAKYLGAAADAFASDQWEAADEAWAAMNAKNSKWFLRIAPDETYWEPCSQKAGYAVTFARINGDSLRWQEKLTPLQQKMEDALAALIGKPYKARKVGFHLPDFIDIVVNAGDARDPLGATIGQSLPNFGKVAEESRGRTMAMTNLYTDDDSLAMRRQQVESLLDAASMADYAAGADPGLVGTILHEATHNLGPAQGYVVPGTKKSDADAFGGQLATMLEELKAQTGALYFVVMLQKAGALDASLARQTWTDSFIWCLGQMSRGMTDDAGRPKPYPQLAAIQIGFLMDEGAVVYKGDGLAANGKDQGAFTLVLDRWPAAVTKMMKTVGHIKASGDRKAAEALVEKYVRGGVLPMAVVSERFLRFPKQSFVYAIER